MMEIDDADADGCDRPEQHRTGELLLEQCTTGTLDNDSTGTNVDFQHLTSLVTKLIEHTEEIKTEALDRERRLIRHIDDLKREVSTLSAALEEEKRRTTKKMKKCAKLSMTLNLAWYVQTKMGKGHKTFSAFHLNLATQWQLKTCNRKTRTNETSQNNQNRRF